MTDVAIRAAVPSDAAALGPLLAALGYPAPADRIAPRLTRLAASGNAVALVASVDGGDDLGGLITAHTLASIHHDAPVAWITTLVVAESARRRGVGRALVRAAEEWARAQGAVRVSVSSGVQRADAHAFYEGLDYALSGKRFTKPL